MKKILLTLVGVLCSLGISWADTYVWTHGATSGNTLSVTAAKGSSSANTYSGYSISYNNKTYTTAVKMESATTLTFTTTKSATITVGVALKNNNTYANASKTALQLMTVSEKDGKKDTVKVKKDTGITSSTTGATSEDGLSVVFQSVGKGSQTITKAGSEEGVFYIKVEEEDANKVNTPIINATWGASCGDATTVTLSTTTADANIYYTTDGTEPTASSTSYSQPFTVSTACTVKAIGIKSGATDSNVATADVTVNNQRKVNFNFSGITLTQGSAIANTTNTDNTTYKLPQGRTYYIEGKTQTGWNDGTQDYALGASVTTDKDYTFTPVFTDNTKSLGDAKATVNWTFAENEGAPSVGLEGKIGYYAAQTTISGVKLDVVMKINTQKGAYEKDLSGKWQTSGRGNCAQVNKGTIFTIPAIPGMEITYTATNGTPTTSSATFAGEAGTVKGSSLKYTYNGTDETIDIIDCGSNLYPSGLSVTYPYIDKGELSDLAFATDSAKVELEDEEPLTVDVAYQTSSEGELSVSSLDESIATAVLDEENNKITITAYQKGETKIILEQAADDNYQAGKDTVVVTVKDERVLLNIFTDNTYTTKMKSDTTIVSEGATDAQIGLYIKGQNLTDKVSLSLSSEVEGIRLETSEIEAATAETGKKIALYYFSRNDVEEGTVTVTLTSGEKTVELPVIYSSTKEQYAVADITPVAVETTWDFSEAASANINSPAQAYEIAFANASGWNEDFNYQALSGQCQNFVNVSNKYAQGSLIRFKAANSGKIKVKFSNTGSSARPYRYLSINGTVMTDYKSKSTSKEEIVETEWLDVEAGDVILKGIMGSSSDKDCEPTTTENMLRFYSISFSPDAPAVTLNANGYATFAYAYPTYLPYGNEIYSAKVDEEAKTITWTLINSDVIPANTGVLIKGDANSTIELSPADEESPKVTTDLKANLTQQTKSQLGDYIYVLSGNTFKRLADTGTLSANKAYFQLTQNVTSAAKDFTFVWDETTAISNISNNVNNNAAAYNLAGQRVNANAKGLVIMNGKKHINK